MRFVDAAIASGVAAQNTLTATSDVAKAAATAKTESPTSHVKGKSFDRFVIIWLENTDYNDALNDREFRFEKAAWFKTFRMITLTGRKPTFSGLPSRASSFPRVSL